MKDRLVHLLCRPQSTYKTVTFERLNFLQMPLILLYIIAHILFLGYHMFCDYEHLKTVNFKMLWYIRDAIPNWF